LTACVSGCALWWLSNIFLNDTWEWDGEAWTQVADTAPTPRGAHAITFDSVRQRVVLFGGLSADIDPLNDTWEWDGAVWTHVADTGPSPRMEHAMTFDSVRQRVVLFGGHTITAGLAFFNDTCEWDGEVWTQVADFGPSPRSGYPAMAQMGTRTALFGGYDGIRYLTDTWEWKDLRWTQRQDMGPPARVGHRMAYDGQRERAVLFGGAAPGLFGDTWELAINQPPAKPV
jgi:N-acetylneuraminic acid mutarotase